MNKNNTLSAYISEYNLNSETLIAYMDNAPFHRSKIFQEKIKEWKEKNIEIFYLPEYSHHLNLIEIL